MLVDPHVRLQKIKLLLTRTTASQTCEDGRGAEAARMQCEKRCSNKKRGVDNEPKIESVETYIDIHKLVVRVAVVCNIF